LSKLTLGTHKITIKAVDNEGNVSIKTVTFNVTAPISSLKSEVNRFYKERKITDRAFRDKLTKILDSAQNAVDHKKFTTAINKLESFISEIKGCVKTTTGRGCACKKIEANAANHLMEETRLVIASLKLPKYR
jgi:hypothetical protein